MEKGTLGAHNVVRGNRFALGIRGGCQPAAVDSRRFVGRGLAEKGKAIPALGYDTHDPNYPMGPAETVSVPDFTDRTHDSQRDFTIPASMVPVVDDLVAALVERDRKIADLQRRLGSVHKNREIDIRQEAPALASGTEAPGQLPASPFILAVGSRKGGIGKTTTAVNLSMEIALRGMRTLLVDLDPQGHATQGLGITQNGLTAHDLFLPAPPSVRELVRTTAWPGLSLIPADTGFNGGVSTSDLAVLKRAFRTADTENRYDVVILDLPPTLDATVKCGLACADALLVPLLPHPLALDGAARIIHFFKNLHATRQFRPAMIGIAPMMFDTRVGLHRKVLEQAARRFGTDSLFRSIRIDIRLAEAFAEGRPIRHYAPRSRGSLDYHLLANDIIAAWMPSHGLPREGGE